MRFVILTRSRFPFTTRLLVERAKLRRHDVRVAAPADCLVLVTGGQPQLLHKGRLPSSAEAVIPRLGSTDWDHGLVVLRTLERLGVPILNAPDALALCRERFACVLALANLGIPVPATAAVADGQSFASATEHVGGTPALLSPALQGLGRGVLIDQPGTVTTISAIAGERGRHVLQRASGVTRELRIYVVGGSVIGAVSRRPQWSRAEGAKAGAAVEAPDALQRLALRAMAGLGLQVAAVDFAETTAGPLVVDVDPAPNLRGIAPEIGASVIEAIIRRAESLGVSRIPV